MTNPLLFIRNKFCFWLTGLTHDEIASLIDKVNEQSDNSEFIKREDFDPDDYDFSPLNDYDFSQFVDTDYLSNEEYVTKSEIEDIVSEQIDSAVEAVLEDYVKFEVFDRVVLELKSKKKAKKSKPTA